MNRATSPVEANASAPVSVSDAPSPARHAWAKRCALHALALATTGLCTLLLFLEAWPIDPAATFWDNAQFYYPRQAAILAEPQADGEADQGRAGSTFAELIVSPFFRVVGDETDIRAAEAKPVYVVALRVWGMLYRVFRPDAEFPNAFEFMLFVTLSTWWMGYALWLVADRMGAPWIGLGAAVLLLANCWQMNYLFSPHYTQFSLAILLCAFLQCLEGSPRAVFTGGILSSAALLSNNAMLVYLPGMALAVGFLSLPNWKKSLANLGAYVGGGLFVFAFFGAISYTEKVRVLCGDDVISPWTMLARYYEFSLHRNHFLQMGGLDHVPKQLGMFFEILRHTSVMWLIVFASVPFVVIWKTYRRGWRNTPRTPWLRTACALLLVAVPAVAAIEFGPAIQLGRAYFLAIPFWLLASLLMLDQTRRLLPARVGVGMIAVLAVLYAGEFGMGLRAQHQAWHGTQDACIARMHAGDRLLFLKGDSAAMFMLGNMKLAMSDERGPDDWDQVDVRDSERIAEWTRQGRVLLMTGFPQAGAFDQPIPRPLESDALLSQVEAGRIRSSQGPIVVQLIDRWPHGPHPHQLFRYEDELLWWRFAEKQVVDAEMKFHVWELSPAKATAHMTDVAR